MGIEGEILTNRYQVEQQLGKKAGRRTLLARDLVTDELVVVKLLSLGSDFVWDDLKLFEREADTLKSLSHRLIPRYLDYFELQSPNLTGFVLVQTYIPALNLEQHLQAGRNFTEAEITEIAKALLEILIYLHGLHPPVIHRDIKPSNILLGERSGNSVGQVYLVDFGSVQTVLAAEGGTRTVVGTYGYMPLEQFGGRTIAASDLYSLGATLIYLATGIQPADLPQKDFRLQFEQLANLSPHFSRWLQGMSEPSLEKRFPTAREALTALEGLQFLPTDSSIGGKPAGSKIQLTKNQEALEILIPPHGFHTSMISTATFAIAWNSFILFWTIGALTAPFPVSIPFALFSLPFWSAGFSMVYSLLFSLFGISKLRIDRQQITFTRELFKLKFHRFRPLPTQSITNLIYTQAPAKLEIWAGIEKYQVGGSNGIIKSVVEMEWLAGELSHYLGIKITG